MSYTTIKYLLVYIIQLHYIVGVIECSNSPEVLDVRKESFCDADTVPKKTIG